MCKVLSPRLAGGIVLIAAAVAVYLLNEPPRVGETWNLWFFGRMFRETGAFMTPGRSPLYAVYTSLFLPLGYPMGPMVVRVLDAAFMFAGLFALLRQFVGGAMGMACALIWLPGMLQLGSAVSGLALSSLFGAFVLRKGPLTRSRHLWSYAFFILAGMLRPNYMPLVPVVALYDAFRLVRRDGVGGLLPAVRPRRADWPLALVVGAFVLFAVNQSDHRWNNGWVTDTRWFGTESSSLGMAAHLGALVQWVIIDKHGGDYDNHDGYFVIKEEFGEVESPLDLLKRYDLYWGLFKNNQQIVRTITLHTDLGRLLVRGGEAAGSHKFAYPIFFALLLMGAVGFYRAEPDPSEKERYLEIFAASVILTLPLLFIGPSGRYTLFWIPVFAAAGLWYGRQLAARAPWRAAAPLLIVVPFLLFSNATSRVTKDLEGVFDAESWQRPSLVRLDISERQLAEMTDTLSGCRGIMSNDHHTFLAAFSGIPIERFHTIHEIPPFGRYGEGAYRGLRPDRIDCVVVVKRRLGRGWTSYITQWTRYENYVAPYIEVLRSMGAKTVETDFDGGTDVIVLR